MILFCVLSIIIMVWGIFDEDSGCLKVALFYAGILAVLLGIYTLKSYYKSPEYNDLKVIKSYHGATVYRFSHSQYRCPNSNGLTFYCVENSDFISPTRNDTCVNCGSFFWEHEYEKSSEEEELDELFWQKVAETPAE